MELKPCPFCGNKPEAVQDENPRLQRYADVPHWYVYCAECEMFFGYDHDYGGVFGSMLEAMVAWNKRRNE
jgi:Lar family restriction alleviation protein